MIDEHPWFDLCEGPGLLQGDIIRACPVSALVGEWTVPLKTEDVTVDFFLTDVIVMTQSCDLEANKVDQVLVAKVVAWRDAVHEELNRGNTAIKSRDFRRKLIDGAIPGLSQLHKHDGPPMLEWSIVNFHRLYTLPKAFLQQYAQSLGTRLRLRSPYREHLAQGFARYFMRVGLPHDAKAFEREGDVAVT